MMAVQVVESVPPALQRQVHSGEPQEDEYDLYSVETLSNPLKWPLQ